MPPKRRSPHGERGLKPGQPYPRLVPIESLPTRGAWIETGTRLISCIVWRSRSPHGERGLKLANRHHHPVHQRRSPHGERGLKRCKSAPPRLWVRRSPHGERGLKPTPHSGDTTPLMSLPTRGAWIETPLPLLGRGGPLVAPHTGSVD